MTLTLLENITGGTPLFPRHLYDPACSLVMLLSVRLLVPSLYTEDNDPLDPTRSHVMKSDGFGLASAVHDKTASSPFSTGCTGDTVGLKNSGGSER